MTDENRAGFRSWLADMIAVATSSTGVMDRTRKHHYPAPNHFVVEIGVSKDGKDIPPLTTAQQLALSVLLGDESVLPQAMADYLLDQGHEYATAVAEKARAEERERIAAVCDGCAEACQLGVLSGSTDSLVRQSAYRNIAATTRKLS